MSSGEVNLKLESLFCAADAFMVPITSIMLVAKPMYMDVLQISVYSTVIHVIPSVGCEKESEACT